MKKFELLEHRSDLKIQVFGRNEIELFENAMIGMFESAEYQPQKESKEVSSEIKISSFDLTSLLVDFLNEVLYLAETKKEVYHKAKFKKFSQKELEGTLFGKKLKTIGVYIKAATYHQLSIKKTKKGILEAVILFDI